MLKPTRGETVAITVAKSPPTATASEQLATLWRPVWAPKYTNSCYDSKLYVTCGFLSVKLISLIVNPNAKLATNSEIALRDYHTRGSQYKIDCTKPGKSQLQSAQVANSGVGEKDSEAISRNGEPHRCTWMLTPLVVIMEYCELIKTIRWRSKNII